MMSGIHVVVAHLILEERPSGFEGSRVWRRASRVLRRGAKPCFLWRNLLSGLYRFDQQKAQRLREGAGLLTQSFR